MAAMKKSGYEGEIVKLSSEANMPIVRAGQATGEAVATAGLHHYGVKVGEVVYEMNSTKGIPIAKWAEIYETVSPSRGIVPPFLSTVPK